jgi:hypothetical protein
LPSYRVVLAQFPIEEWYGECLPARRLIRLKRGLTGAPLRETLLHEMCHIGGPFHHGQRFQAKLAHLVAQGEAWAQAELDYYRQGHGSWPQHLRQLKAMLGDLASAQPRPSLVAVRRMAADTLACRPSEVRRKVPWLDASWRQACAQADQSRARRASRQRGPGR